jgi:adenylate cyclase
LAFDNLSDDPKQAYFADGIVEDLITDLSKIFGVFVVARNSSFAYKGKSVKVRKIAEALGVRYVMEGSVRRAGNRVRINAQLIDATTGGHLWAERYDGELRDIFALQDRVTGRIVSALSTSLNIEVARSIRPKETNNPEAYDAFLRGWSYYRRGTVDSFAEAIPHFKNAIVLDPDYSRAYAALAAIYWTSAQEKDSFGQPGLWLNRLGMGYGEIRREGNKYLNKALERPVPLAYQVASGQYFRKGKHEDAIAAAKKGIALDDNDPVGYEAFAKAYIFAGDPKEGEDAIRKAMRLDPYFSTKYMTWLGLAQFGQEQFSLAAKTLKTAIQSNPEEDAALIVLASSLGHLGRKAEAASAKQTLDQIRRKRGVASKNNKLPVEAGVDNLLVGPLTLKDIDLWPFKAAEDRERLRAGLRLAGVPETTNVSVSPEEVEGATTVEGADAKALFDKGVSFIDVRNLELWKLGHILGATLLDLKADFTRENLSKLANKDDPIVIYCEGHKCLRSSKACSMAVTWKFTQVYY